MAWRVIRCGTEEGSVVTELLLEVPEMVGIAPVEVVTVSGMDIKNVPKPDVSLF